MIDSHRKQFHNFEERVDIPGKGAIAHDDIRDSPSIWELRNLDVPDEEINYQQQFLKFVLVEGYLLRKNKKSLVQPPQKPVKGSMVPKGLWIKVDIIL
jgi:hypothetical protein